MGLFSFLGALSPAHINLFTALSGAKRIGTDGFGNVYFEKKARKGYAHARRWVVYKDSPEASIVPPEWHGWLHHQTDAVPSDSTQSFRRPWQKPHVPNLTGTTGAYRPQGHILSGGKRPHAVGDYEAWMPPQ